LIPQSVVVGWSDEMNRADRWKPLGVVNQAKIATPKPGLLSLSLKAVPAGWPYEYQWSGVTQEATVDVGKYPVLAARVVGLEGYAHLDIDVLDAKGKAVKGLRASTLTEPGLTKINLGESLDPAVYHLRIRLIVGGPNSGCRADYSWIRFYRAEDDAFVTAHPDYQGVVSK
jgi:hypothetical protein